MKWITLTLLILSGCAMIGTDTIHSPSSTEGFPGKSRHVHGGPTRKAPPDKISFKVNDSTYMTIQARTIFSKTNFIGIVLPIFPTFWLHKTKHYEDIPNSLIIQIYAEYNNVDFQIISAALKANDQIYEIQEITKNENSVELSFPLSAEKTSVFELSNLQLVVGGKPTKLPEVKFRKLKQRWTFIGP